MSIAGTARDAIINKLTSTFTSKQRITKPRALELNNDNLLKDGVGIYIGSSTVSDTNLGFHISTKSTEIIIILTKRYFPLDNKHEEEAAAEDALSGEKDTVITAVAEVLRDNIGDGILDLQYVGDDGGQFIFGEKTNHLALSITYNLVYNTDKTYCN